MAIKKRRISFLSTIFLILNIIFVLCLLLSYLAPYISPEKFWPLAFFGLAYPLFLAINLLFILIWLILWKKYIFISLLAIVAGYNNLFSLIRFVPQNDGIPSGGIKILTYNVHSLYGVSKEKYGQGIHTDVTRFISGEKPDIVCIQEFLARSADSNLILPSFADAIHLPHYAYKNYNPIKDARKVDAMAIFSAYPILTTGYIRLNRMNVFAVYADILIGKERVRLYNLHLKSISLGPEDYSVYSKLTVPEAADEESEVPIREGFMKIFYKLKNAFIIRARQVDILSRQISQSPYPVIICGDFNDTPGSYTFHKVSEGFKDSFRQSGKSAFGNTYAGKFPSFRIDYILFNGMYKAFGYKRYNIDISDHYPVSVYLTRD
ncbi:MAG: endonuclease/exonuclease/phosphatase family protein [Syntrophothermus sp.]